MHRGGRTERNCLLDRLYLPRWGIQMVDRCGPMWRAYSEYKSVRAAMSAGAVLCLSANLLVAVLAQGFSANVTGVLNSLLSSDYDQRIRPDIGGTPTKVTCNMLIKSMGPVEENEQTFYMDVYFRQSWFDRRLGFSFPGIEEFSMSWLFVEKIWKPDTYFLNGKKSHLHRITSPNKFVRLRKDGFLTYSMRLTIASQCKMYLRKFPLDSQKCSLIIGSYGYTLDDVNYMWDEAGVTIEEGVEMAQYLVVNVSIEATKIAVRGKGDPYSVIEVSFHMRRSIGYFMLQIYVPITLVVCSSWISFWITPSDSSGRTSLGVTTVLSITTLGFGGRASLPKVSYATALDWYVIICFAFAFAVMIEYAIINFMDKIAADIKKLLEEEAKKKAEMETEEVGVHAEELKVTDDYREMDAESLAVKPKYSFLPHRWFSVPADLSSQPLRDEHPWTPVPSMTPTGRKSPSQSWYRHTLAATLKLWKNCKCLPKQQISEKGFSQIDIFARRAFPLAFAITMTTYTLLYAYYITDMSVEDE